MDKRFGAKTELPTPPAFECIATALDAHPVGAIARAIEIERQNRRQTIEPQAAKEFRLFRRPHREIGLKCRSRIVGRDHAWIERNAQRTRLAPEIEREMWALQSFSQLAEVPPRRLAHPKDHKIGWIGPVFAHGEYCAEIIDGQFLPSRREAAILALRRRLRRVIIKE